MAYSEQTWIDGAASGTPITAARLQHLEDGVAAAAVTADIGAAGTPTGDALRTTFALSLNPLNYGAVGNGTGDDTSALNAVLAAAKARGVAVVDGGGRTYKVTDKVVVDSVGLRNCVLTLSGGNACVRMTGTSPRVEKVTINGDATTLTDFYGVNGGCINLVGTLYAVIDDVTVTSAVRRSAVYTSSAASHTRINQLRTFTGWGILFNDTSFVDRTNIDGVNYSASPIGKGLTVTNCDFFGPSDVTFTGDAVEVNTPAMRFANVTVQNCRVWKTYTTSNVGIGYGFANVDHITVDGCYAENVPSPAGAYHAEYCTDIRFVNNTAKNVRCGAGISSTLGTLVSGNRFEACWEFSLKSQNTDTASNNLMIVDNTFIGLVTTNGVTAFHDIIIGNANYVTVSRNKFVGMGMTGLTHINFSKYGSVLTGVTYAELNENLFANTTGFAATALVIFDALTKSLHSAGNNFTTYTGPANGFLDRVSNAGVCEDFYTGASSQVAGTDKGLKGMTGGTPQGWVSGAAGRVMDDVVNGVRYKYDTTAGNWTIPGAAYTNPDRMGGNYLWVDSTGKLRIKSSAPASDTDGSLVASAGAATADVQVFSTAGAATWTMPTGAKAVDVICISGGGGGGGGRQGAAGTVRCGGGGGASGAMSRAEFRAADLTATVSLTVGAGGTAGAAASTVDTNGGNGGAGGLSSFGSYVRTLGGGAAGGGGTAAAGAAGAGSSFLGGVGISFAGAAASGTGGVGGGSGSTSGTAGTNQFSGTGGGAGGGITSADSASAGGPSGPSAYISTTVFGAGGVVGGASPTVADAPGLTVMATGGGGGAASLSTVGQSGARGGNPGGGGGGGGASLNGSSSGAGGVGGAGVVVVTTYF